jgi:hypothetical protein
VHVWLGAADSAEVGDQSDATFYRGPIQHTLQNCKLVTSIIFLSINFKTNGHLNSIKIRVLERALKLLKLLNKMCKCNV